MKRYPAKGVFILFLIIGIASAAFLGCASTSKNMDPSQISALEPSALLKFADIPVPAGFKLIGSESYAFQSSNFRAGLLRYSGKAQADQVVVFYKEQMPMYNWSMVNVVEFGRRMVSFEKERENCTVIIDDKGGKSEITISIAPRSQSTTMIKAEKAEKEKKLIK